MKVQVVAALLLAAMPLMAGERHHGDGMSIHTGGPVTDCSQVNFKFASSAGVAGEERLAIAGRNLTINLSESGGIPVTVTGSDRSGYAVLLCKGAADSASLAGVRLDQSKGALTVVGPDGEKWGGVLVISAPRDAQLDVSAKNGPVSISNIEGRLNAKVKNGPLKLEGVGGNVDVAATNGPVSFSGNSGDVKLVAENGPVTIRLSGASWEGGELHSTTKNGPLTLKIPDHYGTGVVVERSEHAPLRCASDLCGDRSSMRAGEGDERIALGSGATRVHLSSENGPISISESK
jgi:hypothetical protein